MSLAALEHDRLHDFSARRLLVGYASAGVVLATVAVLGVVFGKEIKRKALEEAVPVVFAPQKPPTRPAPAKVETPRPPAPKAKSSPPPLGRPATLAPRETPTEAPKQGNPTAPLPAAEGVVGGSLDGVVGGTGTGGPAAGAQRPSAPPAPTPPPAPMAQTTENVAAPRVLARALPTFPEAARRAGVQATVRVRYVVREDGSVTDVVIVRGHPLLDAEVVRAVSAWRFSPAMLDGRPARVVRFANLPFRPRL
ncbi:MAG TPA: energy transducer TonB [Polyangiaceae bacterium]|nr:energy transducer TonB [Polyangiaceae bacterium]